MNYEYNHGARTQSPRLSAGRSQLLSGSAGWDVETKKSSALSASFVATYHTRVRSKQQSVIVLGSDALVKKNGVKRLGTSLHDQTGSQRRLGCLRPGPSEVHSTRLFAAPDTAVADFGFKFLSPNTTYTCESHKQTNG